MTSMLLHNESNNKKSVSNVLSPLFEFVLGVAGHLLVLRRECFSSQKWMMAEQNTGNIAEMPLLSLFGL